MKSNTVIATHLVVLALAAPAGASHILRVDASAPLFGDGLTWGNAFSSLQNALAAARANPDIEEIWVAKGNYSPGNSASATFDLPDSVKIIGGFPPGGGTQDPEANPTILGGLYFAGGAIHKVQHVVTCNVNIWAWLEGVTIRNGNAVGELVSSGGGVMVESGEFRLYDSKVESNRGFYGGGIWVDSRAGADVKRVVFSENSADVFGGAIFADFSDGNDADVNISHSIFLDNSADRGGAVYSEADLVMTECLLARNVAAVDGGGIFLDSTGSDRVVLRNLTIADNEATYGRGGGMFMDEIPADSYIANTIVYFNVADSEPEAYVAWSDTGLPDGYSNWVSPDDPDPMFKDRAAGDYRLRTSVYSSSPCVNAGDNGWLTWLAKLMGDLDGEKRIQEGVVDIGAFEQAPPQLFGDANGDFSVDFRDITDVLTNWGGGIGD